MPSPDRSPAAVFAALTRVAHAARGASPDAVFAALDAATGATLGHRLFTLMVFHAGASETERVYTSQPGAYPVRGRKAVTDTPWTRRVFRDGSPYVGATAADIRDVFPDHATILSLGCESVLNVPVVWRGRVLGTMNLLHEARWYRDDDASIGVVFAIALIPAYLARLHGGD